MTSGVWVDRISRLCSFIHAGRLHAVRFSFVLDTIHFLFFSSPVIYKRCSKFPINLFPLSLLMFGIFVTNNEDAVLATDGLIESFVSKTGPRV